MLTHIIYNVLHATQHTKTMERNISINFLMYLSCVDVDLKKADINEKQYTLIGDR